jgi:hypothetical protein
MARLSFSILILMSAWVGSYLVVMWKPTTVMSMASANPNHATATVPIHHRTIQSRRIDCGLATTNSAGSTTTRYIGSPIGRIYLPLMHVDRMLFRPSLYE